MLSLGRVLAALAVSFSLSTAGCSAAQESPSWQGPQAVTPAKATDWTFGQEKGKVLETRHYRIHTTIKDEEVLELLPQVMEGALTLYQSIAPDVKVSDRPMDCYIFRWRSEWDEYTQRYTGADAKIYLQIRSGGYSVGDRYVAYYIGRLGTYSVAAHEGWHQYAGRHFKGRLPPFFEEGLSCMFETISWKERLPRWNISVNTQRALTLRKAIEGKHLYSLEQLCSMHAGDIVGDSHDRIDTFYAQCWAFARFLWEGENQKYRPAMQKWIAETAAGTVHDPTRTHKRAILPWNRKGVKPMLEHYLGADLKQIDERFNAYMKQVAYDDAQLRS